MSLLQVLNGQQAQAQADAEVQQRYDNAQGSVPGATTNPYDGMVGQLDAYVAKCWEAAKSAKEMQIEPDMLEDMRQRAGQYSPTRLAEIEKAGGSEIFMQLTGLKCRSIVGWIRDVMLPSGERPYRVIVPAAPDDLQPEIKQAIYQQTVQETQQAITSGMYPTPEQVYNRARAMYDEFMARIKQECELRAQREEDAIDEELIEAKFYDALDDFIEDFATYPAAFIKGPVIRKVRKLKWVPGPNGRSVPQALDELKPLFYSPSPLDMYPSSDAVSTEDGYLCERIRFRRNELERMRGIPGYDDAKITAALAEYQNSGFDLPIAGEQQRRWTQGQMNWQMTPDHGIDGIEFNGFARGEWLLQWGMPAEEVPDKDAEYAVTCLHIGRFTVRCVLNEDPMRRRPYMKASYDSVKGQFWGKGPPRLMKHLQDMCNAAARSLCNNMAFASGPMYEVEVDRLAAGEDATLIYPWRMFQTQASKTTPAPAVRFFMPPDISEKLMKVYDYFHGQADEVVGIPNYEQGVNPTTGAAGTASGLSMLMSAMSRQIKRVVAQVDNVVEGAVQRMHTHLMLFGDNPDVKGSTVIEARGAASLIAKEQLQMRRLQLLQQTANPIDAPLFGAMGRATMWREALKTLDMNPDDVLPSQDEMMARQMQQQMMQQAMMQGGPPMLPAPQPGPGAPNGQGPQAQPVTLNPAGQPAGGVEHNTFMQRHAA